MLFRSFVKKLSILVGMMGFVACVGGGAAVFAAPYLTALHVCTTDPGGSANCAADASTVTVSECSAGDGVCTGTAGDTVVHVTGSYTNPSGCSLVTDQGANAMRVLAMATSSANCGSSNGLNCVSYANIGNGSGTGSCAFSTCGPGVNDGTFNCTVALRYNSEPDSTTHWRANAVLFDGTDESSITNYTSSTFDIAETLAIGVTPTISFFQPDGVTQLVAYSVVTGYGISTSGDATLTVYNTGNTPDTHVRFYAIATSSVSVPPKSFACTFGDIPSSNFKWQATSGTEFFFMQGAVPTSNDAWSGGSTTTLGISNTNDISAGAKQTLYFKLRIPTAVAGTCTGSIYFTAV